MFPAGFLKTAAVALGLALLSAGAVAEEKPAAAPAAEAKETTTAEAERDLSLSTVLQTMQQQFEEDQAKLEAREAHYQKRLKDAQRDKRRAEQRVADLEAEGRRLENRFEDNRVELIEKDQLLKEKIGALKELFGLFQQNASDLIGAFVESPTSLQYPDRDVWLHGFANRMKNASEVTSGDDIRVLWQEILREIAALSQIVAIQANVTDSQTGNVSEQTVVRVGGFNIISDDGYLQWKAGKQQAETMPRQPAGPYLSETQQYLSADSDLNTLSVDPSGGILVELLAAAPTQKERVDQGGIVGYMILGMGAVALLLTFFKLVDISKISLRVNAQRKQLNRPKENNGLGRLQLAYERFAKLDTENLEMKLHDVLGKETARVNRFTVFLAIISAVAPLMGLLGTVVGMINTFQAITLYGTGDPQTMAGGISQALITTVLGLVVAVPAVLLYSLVTARGKAVVNIYQQHMAVLLGDRSAAEHIEELNDEAGDLSPALQT